MKKLIKEPLAWVWLLMVVILTWALLEGCASTCNGKPFIIHGVKVSEKHTPPETGLASSSVCQFWILEGKADTVVIEKITGRFTSFSYNPKNTESMWISQKEFKRLIQWLRDSGATEIILDKPDIMERLNANPREDG